MGSRVSNRRLGRSGERRQQFCSNETQARVVSQLVFPPGELGDYKRAGFSHAASEPCLLRQGSAESGGTREKTGYGHSVEKRYAYAHEQRALPYGRGSVAVAVHVFHHLGCTCLSDQIGLSDRIELPSTGLGTYVPA